MAERELDAPLLDAITSGEVVRPAIFYAGDYATGTLRLWTGVGSLSWGGYTWLGAGNLLGMSTIQESRTLQAIGFEVRLSGLPAANLSLYLQSQRKNAAGRLWLGFMQPVSYVSLPGTSGNNILAPDNAALATATVDLDVIVKAAPDSATPATVQYLAGQDSSVAATAAWRYQILTSGRLRLSTSDGAAYKNNDSTASPDFTTDPAPYLRAKLTGNNGAGSRVASFWQSSDYSPVTRLGTWTQIGATVTTAGVAVIQNSSLNLSWGCGAGGTSLLLAGKLYYGELRAAIDGAAIARFDPRRFKSGETTMTSTTGEVYTLGQSGSPAAVVKHLGEQLLADPYPLRRGRFDIAPITREGNTVTIAARYEDRLIDLERARERRWTPEDQKLRLPGDRGFDQVADLVDARDFWGGADVSVIIPPPLPLP